VKLDPHSVVADLDPAQVTALRIYERMLRDEAAPAGLVSRSDRTRIWERHVLDSLRSLACLPHRPHRIADLGSGAGLPGVPVAISRPDCRVLLVEARQRRVAFLERSVDVLSLSNASVVPLRAEQVTDEVDVCLARALGDARRSWEIAAPLLKRGGRLVYFGGRTFVGADVAIPGVRYEIFPGAFPWQGPLVKMVGLPPDSK
jgi:16S rRNA (guanine527-N7)-methyltransferase